MPAQAPGSRHTAIATKVTLHGQVCAEDGFVGVAFKSRQVDRWTRPGTGAGQAQSIAIGEEFEIMLGGLIEAPATGNLAAAAKGNDIYINSANNTLGLAAQGITGTALNAGWLPVGKVDEVETAPTPDRLKINANVAYLVKGTMP